MGVEPVAARGEGDLWVVLAHFRVQPGHLVRGDIGRVGDDEVELALDAREPVGFEQREPVGDAMGLGIGARDGEGRGRNIGGEAGRGGPFGEQGDGEDAGSGAEIEQALRRFPLQGGFDDGFGFRSGIKDLRGHFEVSPPEHPPPDDARDRLVVEPAVQQRLVGGHLVVRDLAVVFEHQPVRGQPERMGEQRPRVAPRRRAFAAEAEQPRALAKRLCQSHASISASFAAWSASIRASITSSRSPPSTSCSR